MKRERLTALLLALVLALSLAACAQQANYTTDKLNVWIWDESQRQTLEELAAPWAQKSRIEVVISVRDEESYWEEVSGGLMPDLMWVDDAHLGELAEKGALLQLDEQVKSSRKLALKEFPQAARDALTLNGHTYAVPMSTQTWALWYNRAMFDSIQHSYPDETWTWEQVRSAAQELTDRAGGHYGIVIPCAEPSAWYQMIYAYGGSVVAADENGAQVSGWQDGGTVKAMNTLSGMIVESMPSQIAMDELGAARLFAEGDAGMILQSRWQAQELLKNSGSGQWACTLLPYEDLDGSGECGEGERICLTEAVGWAVSARSTDTNAAFELLEVLGGSAARKTLNPEPPTGEDGEAVETPLTPYDRMEQEAVLVSRPRQLPGESWEDYAVNTTMYTAWNDPSRMSAMLTVQHRFTQSELLDRQPPAAETETES